ncbi:hypothetical protein [Pseudophaeobacter flagellatus]|uniref:hypothetical protein n=1 Tax=Pseudophaeobacter flagellatus TaxID=2899119 RepID=UPI001E5CEDB6|nr:hypothetical protein [Pseudophaeobacter flagellatus]MCD9147796.1 hypothetical protein [Pseudophaeobacter flagellatus]
MTGEPASGACLRPGDCTYRPMKGHAVRAGPGMQCSFVVPLSRDVQRERIPARVRKWKKSQRRAIENHETLQSLKTVGCAAGLQTYRAHSSHTSTEKMQDENCSPVAQCGQFECRSFAPPAKGGSSPMNAPFANTIDRLAAVVAEKWYAALGAAGLVAGVWTMLIGSPHDDLLIGSISAAMIGIGFGEAETHTFRQRIYSFGVVEIPFRKFTFAGVILYFSGCCGVVFAALRGLQLYLGTD